MKFTEEKLEMALNESAYIKSIITAKQSMGNFASLLRS
jgi:hypothetical protein